MMIGTKSLLFGAHQVLWHPLCLALAWRKLRGSLPIDPRIWIAFVIHDWGYFGCPNMDGPEGKMHPWRAARWFTRWIDCGPPRVNVHQENVYRFILDRELSGVHVGGIEAAIARLDANNQVRIPEDQNAPMLGPWGRFCLFHSRSLARLYNEPVSPLCAPDKIAAFMVPRWLYLTGSRWSGELAEYMAEADTETGRAAGIDVSSPEAWFDSVKVYLDQVARAIEAGGDPGVPPARSHLAAAHLRAERTKGATSP